ncbi:Protein of unknown function [Gryllus bimaculatus]|nr:Protein of unknown function [Gryllus bimaculatus]
MPQQVEIDIGAGGGAGGSGTGRDGTGPSAPGDALAASASGGAGASASRWRPGGRRARRRVRVAPSRGRSAARRLARSPARPRCGAAAVRPARVPPRLAHAGSRPFETARRLDTAVLSTHARPATTCQFIPTNPTRQMVAERRSHYSAKSGRAALVPPLAGRAVRWSGVIDDSQTRSRKARCRQPKLEGWRPLVAPHARRWRSLVRDWRGAN